MLLCDTLITHCLKLRVSVKCCGRFVTHWSALRVNVRMLVHLPDILPQIFNVRMSVTYTRHMLGLIFNVKVPWYIYQRYFRNNVQR